MKNYIFSMPLIALFVIIVKAPPALAANLFSNFNNGLKNTGEVGAGYTASAGASPIAFFVTLLGNFLMPLFIGVIGMIILSYGGYTWMMARGDEQKVEKAKAIIANTILALILIFSAYAIVSLIIPLWQTVIP